MIPDCRDIRKNILTIACESGHGHIPSCFSIVEILYTLYSCIRHDPHCPSWPGRDIFVLSKGHAALAHYCVLAHFGYFSLERVRSLGSFKSDFGCHADRLKVPGIEASTGSLGHGIGIAVGMALARRIKRHSSRVYVLIGDGEANEGSVWEAILVAAHQRLGNLTIIYDDNRSHSRGLQIDNATEKLKAFGCEVTEVNGHDVDALKTEILKTADIPRAIVARTTKGYGCQMFVDNQYEWHRRSPSEAQFVELTRELDAKTV
jgi:transketolase